MSDSSFQLKEQGNAQVVTTVAVDEDDAVGTSDGIGGSLSANDKHDMYRLGKRQQLNVCTS